MVHTSSSTIESASINKLQDALIRTEVVEADIPTNDKTPSWDGELRLYKSPDQLGKKDHLLGRIPVQVKGKLVKRLSGNRASFSAEVSDLKNYLNDTGVLFFLVQIVDFDKYKIYYAALHRFDLRRLISEAGDQKSKTIKLEQFPNKHKEGMLQVLHAFLLNKEKQGILLPDVSSLGDTQNTCTEWEKFEVAIPAIGVSSAEDIFEQFLSHPQYVYGKPKNLEARFPIGKIHPDQIVITKDMPIKVDGQVLFRDIDTVRCRGGHRELHIGREIMITFSQERLHYNYTPCGTLNEQIASMTFMVALATGRKVSIGDYELPQFNPSKLKEQTVQEMKDRLQHLHKTRDVLNQLHVTKDLNYGDLSSSDLGNVECLIAGIVEKKPVPLSVNGQGGFGVLRIGNLALLLVHKKSSSGNGYLISDFFESDGVVLAQPEDMGGPKISVSPYIVMTADDFKRADNANLTSILPSIKKYPFNEIYGDRINQFVLELLKLYDNSGTMETLDIAVQLLDYLQENNPDQYPLYQINRMQTEKRRRALTNEENRQLMDIKESAKSIEFKLAASILLESFYEAQVLFEQLAPYAQNKFEEYPIMHLWNT